MFLKQTKDMKIQNLIFPSPKNMWIERKACVLIPDNFFLNKWRLRPVTNRKKDVKKLCLKDKS